MRDRRFVAAHRGGPLSLEHHRLLMRWAHDCAEHVLPLLEGAGPAGRLTAALDTAGAWERGEVRAGKAREAALEAHAAARAASSPVATAVARAVGHAAATAHAADHALGAAHYALKAVKAAGRSVEAERAWQDGRLPPEVRELVLSARQDERFSRV
ncbi:putative immunity protein [Calidithermus chliarophilus]|uniref:putative immunity protein n=1 Tax=Calidithermus chliarophilus TaxID=52023 RepID=UPI0003FA3048|nr:hypothetical protein [Calidithermus chliarophilus]